MEDFSTYLGIHRTLSLTCCMFWIFSQAGGNTISAVTGQTAILPCNKTNGTLTQLMWKMNGQVALITVRPHDDPHISKEADGLNISVSLSEGQLYALVIERVRKSHAGNYTCHTVTDTGVWMQEWELIITGHEAAGNLPKLLIVVAVLVPCVCCLLFIVTLIILRRIYSEHQQNSNQPPTAEMREEQTGHIYENCLEVNVHQQPSNSLPHHYKPKAHCYLVQSRN